MKTSSFKFLVINDLHYRDHSDRNWFEKVADRMRAEKADLCLVLGDPSENGTTEQLVETRAILRSLKIPFYPVVGNHDHRDSDRSAYVATYRNRLNYRFIHRSWQFIGLDTCQGQDIYENSSISNATFRWLDRELKLIQRKQPIILFTHFPMGTKDVFPISCKNFPPLNADALLKRFDDFKLVAVYSGHFHGQTRSVRRGAVLTTGRCCVRLGENHDRDRKKGFVSCVVEGEKITNTFCPVQLRTSVGRLATDGTPNRFPPDRPATS